ncbi:MAG: 50S ribosomal protein L11 methyltransferase [Odoribacteraceae bacterium]|nr:50S ribosomal protein L11 methyltransferase [Odoribacteraceae bacterium]
MHYTEITLHVTPHDDETVEILVAYLEAAGFEGFSCTGDGVKAYIPTGRYQPAALGQIIARPPFAGRAIAWEVAGIEDQDWNKQWEESFAPVLVGDRVLVRASFHAPRPGVEHDIVIDPRMTFGTGHHATTALMLEAILDLQRVFRGREVLDMGCGTGILAILCAKTGAARVTGIDIDERARENALENLAANRAAGVAILTGDAALLDGRPPRYHLVLANISRNVLLEDMPRYVAVLHPGGTLVASGFLDVDLPLVRECAAALGLSLASERQRDNWRAVIFNKAPKMC